LQVLSTGGPRNSTPKNVSAYQPPTYSTPESNGRPGRRADL
jgi:hypothetical protein